MRKLGQAPTQNWERQEAASTKTAAVTWTESNGQFHAETADPNGYAVQFIVYLPPAPVGWVFSFGSDEENFGSGEGYQSADEAKAGCEAEFADWSYERS